MEELTDQVGKKIDNLDLQDKRFEARKRELVEQNHAAKQCMANAFEDLRKRIDQKEHELMKQCDQTAQECIEELDSSTRLILGRIEHLGEAVETIKRNIQQEDDVLLATFYAQNYEQLKRSLLMDSDLP